MGEKKQAETCGRCSMTTVVDALDAIDGEEGGEGGEGGLRSDPFSGERIEVDEDEFRRVSPAVWLSKASAWLDETAQRIAYGR
ncbi:hypothetical protein GCM10027435_22760 [Haloparvum alkalitolerans]|uniref:hypothetical protein n=1 Tax=Haloparvum alkalitolerans TaxID=1042953 RepID=UPI003CF22B7B